MEYAAAAVVVALVLLFVVGALTRRIEVSACCSLADPVRDLRMRAAFENDSAAPR